MQLRLCITCRQSEERSNKRYLDVERQSAEPQTLQIARTADPKLKNPGVLLNILVVVQFNLQSFPVLHDQTRPGPGRTLAIQIQADAFERAGAVFRSLIGRKQASQQHGRRGRVAQIAKTQPSIPVRCVASLPQQEIVPFKSIREHGVSVEDYSHLHELWDRNTEKLVIFVERFQEQPALALDVMIVLDGKLPDEDDGFVADFCDSIARRVRVMNLVTKLHEEREAFTTKVAQVGHTAKTPLQMAVFELETLRNAHSSGSLSRIEETQKLNACIRSILTAKTYIRNIYSSTVRRSKDVDLVSMLNNVIRDARALADERKCVLRIDKGAVFWPHVRDQGTLEVALKNLIDNATKYSADNQVVTVRLKPLSRMRGREQGIGKTPGLDETVVIEIENLGQGIPRSNIEEVRRDRYRFVPKQLPPELQRRRQGEGIGLSLAIEIVEAHGGWLDLRSEPENEIYQNDFRNHWFTKVTVALPVSDFSA